MAPGEKVELRRLLGRPVALLSAGAGRPRLYDLASGRAALADPDDAARRGSPRPTMPATRARRGSSGSTANDTEYRGALPAWRVDFDDGEGRSLYVAADTGAVTARRSTLWRAYDFLWGLHIMDWRGHEDFNTCC